MKRSQPLAPPPLMIFIPIQYPPVQKLAENIRKSQLINMYLIVPNLLKWWPNGMLEKENVSMQSTKLLCEDTRAA